MKSFVLGILVLIAAGSAGIAQTPLAPATQRPTSLAIDSGVKTATATAGAATLNKAAGVITSEALTTAAGATYTLTLTNSAIAAADQVYVSVSLGSATAGVPVITTVKPAAGSLAVILQNISASAPINGTLKISYFVLKN
jgi:hypothetical protein